MKGTVKEIATATVKEIAAEVTGLYHQQCDPVFRLLYARNPDFLKELQSMPVKKIVRVYGGKNNSFTVLSAMLEELFPYFTEEEEEHWSSSLKKALPMFRRANNTNTTTVEDRMARAVRIFDEKTEEEKKKNEKLFEEEKNKKLLRDAAIARRNAFIPYVRQGIQIIHSKIREFRGTSRTTEEARKEDVIFRKEVGNFLKLENVRYKSYGGLDVCKNAAHVISLIYLDSTGNAEGHSEMFEVVKEFLLGFAGYPLDSLNARSIHYALSLCGGVNEARFMASIVQPLLEEEMLLRRFYSEERFLASLTDRAGNNLLHYALSSVYCSDRAVKFIVDSFHKEGEPNAMLTAKPITVFKMSSKGIEYALKGDESVPLLEYFLSGIPYYAMFNSFNKCVAVPPNRAHISREKEIEEQNLWEVCSSAKTLFKLRADYKDTLKCFLKSFLARFREIHFMLLTKDPRIDSMEEAILRGEDISFDKSINHFYGHIVLIGNIYSVSVENTARMDNIVESCLNKLFDLCDSGYLIGARSAAREVAKRTLTDQSFVRKTAICASRTKAWNNSKASKRGKSDACNVSSTSDEDIGKGQDKLEFELYSYAGAEALRISSFWSAACMMYSGAIREFHIFSHMSKKFMDSQQKYKESIARGTEYAIYVVATMVCLATLCATFAIKDIVPHVRIAISMVAVASCCLALMITGICYEGSRATSLLFRRLTQKRLSAVISESEYRILGNAKQNREVPSVIDEVERPAEQGGLASGSRAYV